MILMMSYLPRLSLSRLGNKYCGAMLLICAALSPVRAEPAGEAVYSIEMRVEGFRSSKGVARIALCRPDTGFPDCGKAAVRTASIPIVNGAATVSFTKLPAGTYAASVFHDANANGKLDTFAGIPREGYGFSRNPPFRPRAPVFSESEIHISGPAQVTISMRYLL